MANRKNGWTLCVSSVIYISIGMATVSAGPVALPFSEPFSTLSDFSQIGVNYPQFTAEQAVGGAQEMWYVDEQGLRTTTVTFAALDQPAFSVTPTNTRMGEIVINLDIGWNNMDANPPSCVGCGAAGIRLGKQAGTMSSENTIVFHPGYNAPPGAFRVDGQGGFPNQNMGWVPDLGVLHHLEIRSFPDGLFTIKVTNGLDPNLVYEDSFTNPAAYGGDLGLLAVGGGAAIYKNLSITLENPQDVPGDFDLDGDVDGSDFLAWQRGEAPGGLTPDNLTAWRNNFGAGGAIAAAASTAPEPATLTMLGAAGALVLLRWRKVAR